MREENKYLGRPNNFPVINGLAVGRNDPCPCGSRNATSVDKTKPGLMYKNVPRWCSAKTDVTQATSAEAVRR